MSREIAKVVRDYVETYPFVRDGLDVYVAGCRNGSFPRFLAQAIETAVKGSPLRLNLVVHTLDRGAPLYDRVSAWAQEDQTERGALIGRRTVKVIEGPYSALVAQADDADLVVLADVLPERGQHVALRSAVVDTIDLEGYLPIERAVQRPFERKKLRRTIELTPTSAPALVHQFYAVQAGAGSQREQAEREGLVFEREVSLSEWREEIERFHERFNWVACYDTAVDRHLLEETFDQAVDVIRYSSGLGQQRLHSLTVSSSSKAERVVRKRLASNLERLVPGGPDRTRERIAEALIAEANSISGDLVLRAAGPGTYLNELIGVVAGKARGGVPSGRARHRRAISVDTARRLCTLVP